MSETPTVVPRHAPPMSPSAAKGWGFGCLGVIAIFVALVIWFVVSAANYGDSAEGRDSYDRAAAQVACQDAVKNRLKSPSSASFSDVAVSDDYPLSVTGSVDAENSFGASIRAQFQCSTTGTGDSLTAYVESLG